jgi:ketosteroid isomerase-like protein
MVSIPSRGTHERDTQEEPLSNLKTVQDIYAAFGAGDIPAILAKLAPDVDWEYGQGLSQVPWL